MVRVARFAPQPPPHAEDSRQHGEMVKEGMDNAKTNSTLMAKVEELTLYVIQLEREIDAVRDGKK